MEMFLFKISRREGAVGYGTFREAIVCAASADAARMADPAGDTRSDNFYGDSVEDDWVPPSEVEVTYLGVAVSTLSPEGKTLVVSTDYIEP
jgi:hypothetical protein